MSAILLLAMGILGCDFLLYFLYQWTYGEKRRGLARRSNVRRNIASQPDARPFLISSRYGAPAGARRIQNIRPQIAPDANSARSQFNEVRAHRRIAASFAHVKR
jgi:hypothetical protein